MGLRGWLSRAGRQVGWQAAGRLARREAALASHSDGATQPAQRATHAHAPPPCTPPPADRGWCSTHWCIQLSTQRSQRAHGSTHAHDAKHPHHRLTAGSAPSRCACPGLRGGSLQVQQVHNKNHQSLNKINCPMCRYAQSIAELQHIHPGPNRGHPPAHQPTHPACAALGPGLRTLGTASRALQAPGAHATPDEARRYDASGARGGSATCGGPTPPGVRRGPLPAVMHAPLPLVPDAATAPFTVAAGAKLWGAWTNPPGAHARPSCRHRRRSLQIRAGSHRSGCCETRGCLCACTPPSLQQGVGAGAQRGVRPGAQRRASRGHGGVRPGAQRCERRACLGWPAQAACAAHVRRHAAGPSGHWSGRSKCRRRGTGRYLCTAARRLLHCCCCCSPHLLPPISPYGMVALAGICPRTVQFLQYHSVEGRLARGRVVAAHLQHNGARHSAARRGRGSSRRAQRSAGHPSFWCAPCHKEGRDYFHSGASASTAPHHAPTPPPAPPLLCPSKGAAASHQAVAHAHEPRQLATGLLQSGAELRTWEACGGEGQVATLQQQEAVCAPRRAQPYVHPLACQYPTPAPFHAAAPAALPSQYCPDLPAPAPAPACVRASSLNPFTPTPTPRHPFASTCFTSRLCCLCFCRLTCVPISHSRSMPIQMAGLLSMRCARSAAAGGGGGPAWCELRRRRMQVRPALLVLLRAAQPARAPCSCVNTSRLPVAHRCCSTLHACSPVWAIFRTLPVGRPSA